MRQSVITYVEAIRYGRLGDQYFAAVYSGTVDQITSFQNVIPLREEQVYNGTLTSLVSLIEEDALRNRSDSSRQNIMWWVDISCSERSVSLTREVSSVFGLSEESEAIMLSSNLRSRDKSRFSTGLCCRQGKLVESMTLSVETMWLKRRPVVDMYPSHLHAMKGFFLAPMKWVYEYIIPRISILHSYDCSEDNERARVLLMAESYARNLCRKHYNPMPTGHEDLILNHQEDYLLSASDMRKRGYPKYTHDLVALHLVKYVADAKANCVLSFRAFDDYGEGVVELMNCSVASQFDPPQRAHMGILGRLCSGIRAKVH